MLAEKWNHSSMCITEKRFACRLQCFFLLLLLLCSTVHLEIQIKQVKFAENFSRNTTCIVYAWNVNICLTNQRCSWLCALVKKQRTRTLVNPRPTMLCTTGSPLVWWSFPQFLKGPLLCFSNSIGIYLAC